ncbi:cell envelope integrity protein TolA [Kaarinaea lacus]
MLKEILANPKAMFLAILVHVVLVGILVVSLEWTSIPTPANPKVDIVKAVAIDEKKIQAELDKIKKAEAKKKKKEQDKQRKLDKKAKEAEKKRKREEQRLAKLRKEREAEKKRQKKLQEKRVAEEKRLAKEREEKRKELERLREERLAEEKRLAEAELQKKALEEQKRREAEQAAMREAIAREQAALEQERQKRLGNLRGQYIADIQNAVERNWIQPPTAKQGLSCEVKVNQIPGGEVISVQTTRCIGDDVFRRSVEAAVHRASPLPRPSDPALFDRELIFTFKPKFK